MTNQRKQRDDPISRALARTTMPAMPASEAFAAWYQEKEHRSLDELISVASGPDADPFAKAMAQLAAMLQDAFEAGRQSAKQA